MKKLTLFLGALLIAGASYACDGKKDSKNCCKKGNKKEMKCCKKGDKKDCHKEAKVKEEKKADEKKS